MVKIEQLNKEIVTKIINFLTKEHTASVSEIAKNIGHNRITVSKYLAILKAHDKVLLKDTSNAKLWYLNKNTKKKILIVDDEPHIVNLIKLSLEPGKYQIEEAYTGLDALDKIYTNQPDAIILDIMMPGLNGLELCKKLKQNEMTKKIPILILSAKGEIEDKMYAIECGAEDYLTKPFDPNEIRDRLEILLNEEKTKESSAVFSIRNSSPILELLKNSRTKKKLILIKVSVENLDFYEKQFGEAKKRNVINYVETIILQRIKLFQKNNDYKVFKLNDNYFILSSIKFRHFLPLIQDFKKVLPYFYHNAQKLNDSELIKLKIFSLTLPSKDKGEKLSVMLNE